MVTRRAVARAGSRLLRRIVRTGAVAALVMGVRLVFGVWPAAVVLAAVGLGHLVVLWARAEARLLDGHRPVEVVRGRAGGADHVAFARALAVVAEAYLAECEREARP